MQRRLRTLEVTFKFSQANAMVGDWIEEIIRFRCTAALRASTQIRFIVRAWRQQSIQKSVEHAIRRLARARELADRAHVEQVEALLHLEEILGFRADFNPT